MADIRVTFPRQSSQRPRLTTIDVSELTNEYKVPAPKYRHAAPSAPWPWMDFEQDEPEAPPLSPSTAEPWTRYPQSHFGNWTRKQVERCQMLTICKDDFECQVHRVDVLKDGTFVQLNEQERTRKVVSEPDVARQFWDDLHKPFDPPLRVRALFIENITTNVLQILGACYNIEPFFFASSANWIPSRYQEDPHSGIGDHITVVLPFIRVVNNDQERATPTPSNESYYPPEKAPITDKAHTIDTQAPLVLSDKKILLQDLLAIHMVRDPETNVIISYHHRSHLQKTTAGRLRSLVQRTGDSVYWQKIYEKSEDPTFVFLAILWYALYAWDEALEVLYQHLSEQLEASKAATADEHTRVTRELHKVQAHLLYYQQLLRDFERSVKFVKRTFNPIMEAESFDPEKRKITRELMEQEADNLLSQIERLDRQRKIQSDRVDNATRLAFSTVNIEDSRQMKELTQATLRDSAAMKQISYLTMIFLPASFLASVFGMNVSEINPGTLETLAVYIESTVILTAITAWIVIALQTHSTFHQGGFVERIFWPAYFGYRSILRMMGMVKNWRGQRRRRRNA